MLLSVLKCILDLEDLEVLKTLRSCVGVYFFHFNSDISIVVDCRYFNNNRHFKNASSVTNITNIAIYQSFVQINKKKKNLTVSVRTS